MCDIITKIANIKVRNVSRITEKDKTVCEQYQKYFDETIAQLNKWENIFQEGLDVEVKDAQRDEDNSISAHLFSPEDALEDICEKKRKASGQLASCILDYFNETYNLSLYLFKMEDPERIIHYKEVIDWIFINLNGVSLKERGIENLIKDFRNLVNGYRRTAILNKNRIEFGFIQSLFTYHHSGYQFQYDSSNLTNFMQGLGYYESGKTENIPCSDMVQGEQALYNHKYNFLNAEKLDALRFYKSGKTILSFKSEANASAFYGLFGLSDISR